jgi:hypothetical protein
VARKLAVDRLLFAPVVLLVRMGLLMIYSASAMQIYLSLGGGPVAAPPLRHQAGDRSPLRRRPDVSRDEVRLPPARRPAPRLRDAGSRRPGARLRALPVAHQRHAPLDRLRRAVRPALRVRQDRSRRRPGGAPLAARGPARRREADSPAGRGPSRRPRRPRPPPARLRDGGLLLRDRGRHALLRGPAVSLVRDGGGPGTPRPRRLRLVGPVPQGPDPRLPPPGVGRAGNRLPGAPVPHRRRDGRPHRPRPRRRQAEVSSCRTPTPTSSSPSSARSSVSSAARSSSASSGCSSRAGCARP